MAKARFKKTIDYENATVTVEDLETGDSITMAAADLSEAGSVRAKLYCINDRIPSAANSKKLPAIEAMGVMWGNMKADVWSTRGEGVARVTDLIAALMEYTKQNQPDVEAKLEAMKAADEANGTKDVAALKKHPDLQPILERMKTERQKEREKAAKVEARTNETPLSF